MIFKFTFLVFLCFSSIIFAGSKIYTHPSKLLSYELPKEWKPGNNPTNNPNIETFKIDDFGEFTVSVTSGLNLPDTLPEEIVKMMFPKEKPVTEISRVFSKEYNAIKQTFEGLKGSTPCTWLVYVYAYKSSVIIITLSHKSEQIDNFKKEFEKVIKTVEFATISGTG